MTEVIQQAVIMLIKYSEKIRGMKLCYKMQSYLECEHELVSLQGFHCQLCHPGL